VTALTRRRLVVLVGFLAASLALYWAAENDVAIVEAGLFAILGGLAAAAVRWG
jgi:hypothetical protein